MFVAGWNMPGYLPEMEPGEFDTADEARDFLVDEINRIGDDYWEDEELLEEVESLTTEIHDNENKVGSYILEGGESIPSGLVFWWNESEEG